MARKQTKEHERRRRACLTAFILTLCVLLTALGFLQVEYTTRRTISGNGDMDFSVPLYEGALDIEVPAEVGFFWQFLPARVRGLLLLPQAQQWGLSMLVRYLANVRPDSEAQPAGQVSGTVWLS